MKQKAFFIVFEGLSFGEKIIAYTSIKNGTSSLDFLVAHSTTTICMEIFWFPIKIGFSLSKKE